MHILISALHRPSKPTGVCRHAVNLAQCLATIDKITKITIAIGIWQKDYFETSFEFTSDKIKVVTIDIKNTSYQRNIWFLFGLPKLVTEIDPDLIHLSFPIPFLRFLFSVPIVTTIHDLYPYEYPRNFGYPQVIFNQLFLKQCLHNTDGIVCVSNCTLKSLQKYFSRICAVKKTTVVYNYVDFSHIEPTKPEKINLEAQKFLLTVAQHRHNKNLVLLIRAYNLLLEQSDLKPDFKLAIVGSKGPETAAIEREIQQLSLQDKVILISSIEDSILCWLYQNCELYVAPSSTEGFCLPLAEALYLSCKVVCSNIPIFKEIGDDNCVYFELQENNYHNLASAIKTALQQPFLNSSKVNFRFSKVQAADNYYSFYSEFYRS